MPRNLKNMTLWVSLLTCLLVCSAINPASGARAKCWHVYPLMARPAIQAIVEGASNGDTIFFHAGTYDWSDTPRSCRWENKGAIIIEDKTLKIKGESGTLLVGPPTSTEGPSPDYPMGVNAFLIIDLDQNNDVVFDGLSFETFLRGIYCGNNSSTDPDHDILAPNARNLTVVNCTFSDIRTSILTCNIGGNVLIQNNNMSSRRIAVFCDWYWSLDHQTWQPENTRIRILDNNIIMDKEDVPWGQYGLVFQQATSVTVMNNKISANIGISMESKGAVIAGNSLTDCFQGMEILGGLNGVVIERNELTNITDFGIRLWESCQRTIVSQNDLEMASTSWAGIVSNGNTNYYGQNKIWGAGATAFYLDIEVHHETLQANNVDSFIPNFCHFFLESLTHDNLIVGSGMETNTYCDLGTNNRITGVTPLPGGIGQDLIDAIHLRNEGSKKAREIIQ